MQHFLENMDMWQIRYRIGCPQYYETFLYYNSGILWIVTAIVLFFYRLNKKRYNEIVEDLKKKTGKIKSVVK